MVRWEVEKFGRFKFDAYVDLNVPLKPLRHPRWMNCTGLWLYYWGVGTSGGDQDLTCVLQPLTMGDMPEYGITLPYYSEVEGRTEYSVVTASTEVFDRYNNGTQGGQKYYDFPDTAAMYPFLSLNFYAFSTDPEAVPEPVWAAAEVRYRFED